MTTQKEFLGHLIQLLDEARIPDLIIRKDRPFNRQEFLRRRQIDAMGRMLWVVSPEDAILSKLEWMKGRESDVQYSDVVGVAGIQRGNLDIEYLQKWAEELGVRDKLIEVLEQAKAESEQCDREP